MEKNDRLTAENAQMTVVLNNLKSANRTFAAENATLKEAQSQYCDTINRNDIDAEQMDKNYGQMVLERDALKTENKRLNELVFAFESTNYPVNPLFAENKTLTERIEVSVDALQRIKDWTQAYPLDIFPKPDFVKAAEVLKAAGLNLDGISADNMRHVLEGLQDICEQALRPRKEGGE